MPVQADSVKETVQPLTTTELLEAYVERCDLLAEALRVAMEASLSEVRINRDVYQEYIDFKTNLVERQNVETLPITKV